MHRRHHVQRRVHLCWRVHLLLSIGHLLLPDLHSKFHLRKSDVHLLFHLQRLSDLLRFSDLFRPNLLCHVRWKFHVH